MVQNQQPKNNHLLKYKHIQKSNNPKKVKQYQTPILLPCKIKKDKKLVKCGKGGSEEVLGDKHI